MQQFYSILLAPHNLEDILHFLHSNLCVNVAYFPIKGNAVIIPSISVDKQKKMLEIIEKLQPGVLSAEMVQVGENNTIACKAINAYNHKLAYLVLFSNKRKLNKFDLLVLDKCSLLIAQELLRNMYFQERKNYQQEKWIFEWLNGRLQKHEIIRNIQQKEPTLQPTGCVACIAKINLTSQNKSDTNFMLSITGIARSFFEQQGFYLLNYFENLQMIYILLDKRDRLSWQLRIKNVIKQLKEIILNRNLGQYTMDITFSVGKIYSELSDLKKSFQTAKETLYIIQRTGKAEELFYDDLHIYRIISLVEKHGNINEFISDYLKPVIKYDEEQNGNLLQTLKVLIECSDNKQEAAKRLFISRQTMYHRIQKLEELLGTDFLLPEKKMCIELALYALDYLNKY